jgi:hypothetical protein
MYQLLAVVFLAISILVVWRAARSIIDRVDRLEDANEHLGGRLALLEDAVALPTIVKPDAEIASEASEDYSAHTEPVPMVTEVITLIDDIDDEAKRLRKELRKRGLPSRGDIDEMRARLSEVDVTSHVAVAE